MTGLRVEWPRCSRGALLLVCVAACGRLDTGALVPGAAGSDAAIDAPIPQAPMFVQHTANISSTSTVGATFDQAVVEGDLIVAAFDYGMPADPATTLPLSITDSLGNTYTLVGQTDGPLDATPVNRQYIAYVISQVSGNDTITAVIDAQPVNYFELRLHEYASVSTSQPLESVAGAAGSVTGDNAAQSAEVTTSEANELIFGLVICGGPASGGTGFIQRGSDFGDVTEDMIAALPGRYHAVANAEGDWVATVAAFRGR